MAKHFTGKKDVTKNKYILIVLFIIIIILVGVIYLNKKFKIFNLEKKDNNNDNSIYMDNSNDDAKSKEDIKQQIEGLLEALKSGNDKSINKYIDYNALLNSIDISLIELNEEERATFSKVSFENIKWNIKNIEVNENNAYVDVELTNKNFINVITNLMKKLIQDKNKQIDNTIYFNKLIEAMNETEEFVTEKEKITCIKQDNSWKIQMNNELRNLLYPEIENINNVINKKIN